MIENYGFSADITDHLQRIYREQGCESSMKAVADYYWNTAKNLSKSNVAGFLQGRIDFSQIANDSLQINIQRAQSDIYLDRTHFVRSLARTISNNKLTAIRRENADKRSAQKTIAYDLDSLSNNVSVEEGVMLQELVHKVAEYFDQSSYDQRDKRIIKMGFFEGASAAAIRNELLPTYPDGKGISLSNIRLTINSFIADISKRFNP